MPKVHGPPASRLASVRGRGCQCGKQHGPDEPHQEITQEDMALMIDNWPPAIQQAFSERWKEHFQAELRHANDSGSRLTNGLSPQVLEELIPEIVGHATPEQLNAIANDEDLHHYEMTAGLSELPQAMSTLPRRHVKIKRPGKQQKTGSAKPRSSSNKLPPLKPKISMGSLPPIFTPEQPRGQKRSANSLFSDVPRPTEEPFPESPNGTLSSSLSYDPDELGEHLPSVVDLFAQQIFGDDAADLCMPATPAEAEELLRSEVENIDMFLNNPIGTLNSNALHIAAATGRADLVQQQLYAGVDPSAWLPTHNFGDARFGFDRRRSSLQASSSMPSRLPASNVRAATSSAATPASSLEQSRSLPSGLGHAQPQINPLNFDYCTAMHLAAYYGHWPVIKVLIESGTCDVGQLFSNRNAQGATALHMAAHKNCVEVVRGMLEVKQCEVNAVDNEGRTALHHAAAQGYVTVAQLLWSAKCNIEAPDNHGWTALHHAADMGHVDVVGDLIIGGANVQRVDNRGYTPAHLAAAAGHVKVIEKLLGAGYEVDTLASVPVLGGVYSTGNTCLHLAAQNGRLEMVECLLEKDANPRLIDYRGCDALQCSVEGGHEEVFRLLLEHGCDPLACDHLGATLLHYAANGGNLNIIRHLLSLGCDKDAVTQYGRTVLHYAAFSCRAEALEMLVDLGCDIHHADHEGNTPWHSAAQSMSPELLQKLLDYGCEVDAVNNLQCTALHYASRTGCLPIVDLLLEKGCEIGAVCGEGKTALHCATQMGHVDVVKRLFNYGAERFVNIPDKANWTPLHFAAERGSLTLVTLYIEAGGDVNAQTQQGWAPLHLSTKDNRLQVVEALLNAGANSSLQDSQGRTALHFAARIGDVTMFQTIFNHPTCKPHLADCRGFQLIHYAVEGGNREIVKFLIDNNFGKPDEHQDDRAFTPLHLAARAGHAELVSLLLNVGFSADRPDKNGRTPLHCAAEGGHIGWLEANQANLMNPPGQVRPRIDHRYITRELLAQGVDPTALDDAMCSALHYACSSGDLEVVKELISLGCSPTSPDQIGWSPLMWAAAGGHAPVIQELINQGAEVQVQDNQGRWPLHWAAEKGHLDAVDLIVRLLTEARADLFLLDSVGYPAVNLAANQGHVDIVARILDADREFVEKRYTALHLAVLKDLDQLVQQLLVLPSTVVDARDADGHTALHLAAQDGRQKLAELLITAKANIAATSIEGSTPLHKAAAFGSMEICCLLLSTSGHNAVHLADLKTSNGVTAIQLAAARGHTALVTMLIDAGANVNSCQLSQSTALYNAANGGYLDIVKLLVEHDASIDCQTSSGATALHAAASSGHPEVVKFLLRKKANKDLKAQNGCTALHNATSNKHAAVVDLLVDEGADIDIVNAQGNSALHIAASRGYDKIVQKLVNAGADVHAKNLKNLTAVGCAATGGHLEAVVELVRQGAAWRNLTDVNVVKAIVRKTHTHKHSYLVGKLEIAERERARLKKKAAVVPEVQNEAELREKEAAAESIAAELIKLEEADKLKDAEEKKSKSKRNKKKNKGKKASDVEDGYQESPLVELENQPTSQSLETSPPPPKSPAAVDTPPEPPSLLESGVDKPTSPAQQKSGKQKAKKGKDASAGKSSAVPGSVLSKKQEALRKVEHNDTGWTQVGPSGKIGHAAQAASNADSDASQASHHTGRRALAQEEKPKQTAGKANAQRQGPGQGPVSGRQAAKSAKPTVAQDTESRRHDAHARNSFDGEWAWAGQGLNPQAKHLGRHDRGPARQNAAPNGVHVPLHSHVPPPPPPKPQPAPPQSRTTVADGASSTRSSPARSLVNGHAPRYATYLASSPPQPPVMNGSSHLRGPQLSSSPLRPAPHKPRPRSHHGPSSPPASTYEPSPRRELPTSFISSGLAPDLSAAPPPLPSSQPGSAHAAPSRQHSALPDAGYSHFQAHQFAGPSSASSLSQSLAETSSRTEPLNGGWNPLQGSSATNSLINWTQATSQTNFDGASVGGLGSRVPSLNGFPKSSPRGGFPSSHALSAAFQDLNIHSGNVDRLPEGNAPQSFGPMRSSGHSSLENDIGSTQPAGGMPSILAAKNPWGSSHLQGGDPFQASSVEPPKASSRALCGLTKKPMQNPVVASDMVMYERSAILEWMKHHDYSPLDPSKKFTDKELYPAYTMMALNGM